jgi:hypothetical protein
VSGDGWRWESAEGSTTEHLIPPGRSIGVAWLHLDVGPGRATWDGPRGAWGVGTIGECRAAAERAAGRPRPRYVPPPNTGRRRVWQ